MKRKLEPWTIRRLRTKTKEHEEMEVEKKEKEKEQFKRMVKLGRRICKRLKTDIDLNTIWREL